MQRIITEETYAEQKQIFTQVLRTRCSAFPFASDRPSVTLASDRPSVTLHALAYIVENMDIVRHPNFVKFNVDGSLNFVEVLYHKCLKLDAEMIELIRLDTFSSEHPDVLRFNEISDTIKASTRNIILARAPRLLRCPLLLVFPYAVFQDIYDVCQSILVDEPLFFTCKSISPMKTYALQICEHIRIWVNNDNNVPTPYVSGLMATVLEQLATFFAKAARAMILPHDETINQITSVRALWANYELHWSEVRYEEIERESAAGEREIVCAME